MSIVQTEIKEKNAFVLKLKGSFVGGEETKELTKAFEKIFLNAKIAKIDDKQHHVMVILDMAKTDFMNSFGIGSLLKCLELSKKSPNDSLVLVALSRGIENTLKVIKLFGMFEIFPTVEEALASIE